MMHKANRDILRYALEFEALSSNMEAMRYALPVDASCEDLEVRASDIVGIR